MRRFLTLLVAFGLLFSCAYAEGAETMIVYLNDGAMLITGDGTQITQRGEYDQISRITYDECAPERVLYCAASAQALFNEFDTELDDGGEEWDDGDGELVDEPQETVTDVQTEDDLWTEDYAGEQGEEFDFDAEYFGYEYDYADQLYALMNSRGELLTGFDYSWFDHDVKNGVVIAYRADGFKSVLDETGALLIEGDYAAIVSDGNGGFFATMPDLTKTDEYGDFPYQSMLVRIDAQGAVTDTGIMTDTWELSGFYSGFMCVSSYTGDEAEYIYIDQSGVNAMGKSFNEAYPFNGNYAEVYADGTATRLIDKTGEFVTEPKYIWFDFGATEDLPIIANLMSGGFELLDRQTLSVVSEFVKAEDETDLYAYHSGDRLIFAYSDVRSYIYDLAGDVIFSNDEGAYAYTQYTDIDSQPERIVVSDNGDAAAQCYLLNLDGDVTSDVYKEISALSWISGQGRYLTADYDIIEYDYNGETYYDQSYTAFGIIDQDGKAVLDMEYTEITYLSPTRYWVCDGEKYQLLDADGECYMELPIE